MPNKLRRRILSVTKKDFTIQTFRANEPLSELVGPCDIWKGGKDKDGYGKTTRNNKSERAHRVVWETHNGPIPEGIFVCHHCDNPPCININHLFLGDHSANMQDALKKGRRKLPAGSKHWQSKLTQQQVRDLRKKAKTKSRNELAKEFKLSKGSLSEIINRKRYQNQNKRDTGVRIIHRDSGARGISREHRTQKANREAAFSRLVITDKFQTWLRVETARILTDEHDMKRRANRDVERMMIPRNLRVEVRRDGRWIRADAPKS